MRMTCEICETAYWQQPHCRDCHKSWRGLTKAHCTVCHQTFASNGVADEHWSKNSHQEPRTVKRLERDQNGIYRRIGSFPPDLAVTLSQPR